MRSVRPFVIVCCLIASGCSQKTSQSAQEQAGDYAAAPAIGVSAAPGVAFDYRYAFVMADTKIAQMQELHAASCERLGPARCRITGMQYSLIDDDSVSAQLKFKLDPALARQFGKDGIAAVEKGDGKLVESAIEGTDAGGAIEASKKRSASLRDELAGVERRLAERGLGASARTDLLAQAEELRSQLRGEQGARSDSAEQLANTPMTFSYQGERDFSLGNHPLRDSMQRAWSSIATMLSVALFIVAVLGPWLILGLLLMVAWRSRAGRRGRAWLRNTPGVEHTEDATRERT